MKKIKHIVKIYSTKVELIYYDDKDIQIIEEFEQLLEYYNKKLSMFDQDASLYELNKNKSCTFDDDIYDLIKTGKEHSKNFALNIAIAPIVKLWKIVSGGNSIPSDDEIKLALENSNPDKIILDDISKKVIIGENMSIDLGAIAKGYIADKICDFLKTKGVKSAMINLGGNVKTFGLNFDSPDLNWRIGLQNPLESRNSHLALFAINDCSMVTSGTYERKLIINSKEYHHIFDRYTGYPIESQMKSISIISKSSLDCDIWTTKLFGMDINEAINLVNNNDHLETVIIDNNNQMHISNGISKYLLWKEYK